MGVLARCVASCKFSLSCGQKEPSFFWPAEMGDILLRWSIKTKQAEHRTSLPTQIRNWKKAAKQQRLGTEIFTALIAWAHKFQLRRLTFRDLKYKPL